MKKLLFYVSAALCCFTACVDSKPKIGDAIFYDYVIREGDSVVFNSRSPREDTAFMILESNNLQQPMVVQALKLSLNDSVNFQLEGRQKGFLRLHRIIAAAEFPKYVEEANRKEQVFEQRLKEIGKELKIAQPFYQSRQKTVADSVLAFNADFKQGLLVDKFKKIADSCLYYVVKGVDNPKPEAKKWVWFHYATFLPSSNKVMSSYGNGFPKASNVAEIGFNERIERAAARFDEGTILLMAIPAKSINLDGKTKASGLDEYALFWIEIVKTMAL